MLNSPTVFRPDLAALKAYALPRISGGVKLDAMESPYPFPWPELEGEWHEAVTRDPLNRYPTYEIEQLHNQLSQELGLTDNQSLLLGNGSDELIQILGLACAQPKATVLVPAPSFSMYEVISQMLGLRFATVPLTAAFELDQEVALQAVKIEQPEIVYFAMPNNPTGNVFSIDAVEAVIQAAPGWVVIDEAYTAFSETEYAHWLQQYPNVMVLRTLSKMGLAGIRLGYLAGPKSAIIELNKCRLPYNVNSMTWRTAHFALQHRDHMQRLADLICEQRARLFQRLSLIPQITVWRSCANFLLFRLEQGCSEAFFKDLQRQNIWIKKLDGSHPLLARCFRVSIGTKEENDVFFKGLQSAIENQSG